MNKFDPVQKKTVLVTGASRGIGRAIALKFAREGWQTAITCIQNRERLEEVQKEIQALKTPCLAHVGDMGDLEDCRLLFTRIEETFGRLDALVNNGGISHIGLLQEMTS